MSNTKMLAQKMQADEIYGETVPFIFVRWIVALEVVLAALFLLLFIYQLSNGPVGDRPAPDWFYLALSGLFIAIALFLFQLTRMSIRVSAEALTVTLGFFKRTMYWTDIEEAYLDHGPGIKYGGWGIRLVRDKGGWVLVFDAVGKSRVVVKLSKGRFAKFVFSTTNPEMVMNIIEERLKRKPL